MSKKHYRGYLPIPGIDTTVGGRDTVGNVLPVRLMAQFISKLPSRSLVPYYRTSTFNGQNIAAMTAANRDFRQQLDDVTTRLTRIIMDMRQFWFVRAGDPLDPAVFQRMQADQAIYGRLAYNLLLDGTSPFNLRFNVFDIGPFVQRSGGGFLALNTNLLEMGGAEPVAVYVQENQKIQAQWSLVPDTAGAILPPANVPDAVGVELRGFTMPTAEFERVMEVVRG